MRSAEQLAELMATYAVSPVQQVAQLQFRQRLVESWDVSPGQKLLEIGCGQGDATIVLADAVGPQGHVTAIDRADPSYGAPVNLGDSAQHLEKGPLGNRILFNFNLNVLEDKVDLQPGQFDAVILALCTWYFEDLEELESVLKRVRT
jgi:tRNA A58 N-methylase Trm61